MATKIIVAGSRVIPNRWEVWDDLAWRLTGLVDIEIVSGLARGADIIGKEFAEQWGIPFSTFPADWEKYGKRAGYVRNAEMAEYADELIAYWDGKSNGTHNMITLMQNLRKPYTVIYVGTEQETQQE